MALKCLRRAVFDELVSVWTQYFYHSSSPLIRCDTLNWNQSGCTSLRGGSNILTTRFMGNAAYLDIATGQITSIWNIRAACANNLFPANGVLNVPNLSGGCTCNYMPVSQAFVPTGVIERRE